MKNVRSFERLGVIKQHTYYQNKVTAVRAPSKNIKTFFSCIKEVFFLFSSTRIYEPFCSLYKKKKYN